MKLNKTIFLFTILLFLASLTVMAGEIVVTDADSVWSPDLIAASPDVTDSTDAPTENLIKGAFVSHADSVWSIDLQENGWEAPSKWSFAIITDLHVGFDIPDYDGYSYDDTSLGQDYYLTKRLEAIVDRIIELKDDYNIKFVPVLGDISDTAEYSELMKARNILNKLNDPNGDGNLTDGIPYIPLIGNHDVWPYTQKEGIDPDIRGKENQATVAPIAIGDRYFEGIFWCSFNTLAETKEECLAKNKNRQKILDLFGEFSRQENKDFPYLQNYAFSYKGVGFISLDYIEVARKNKPGYLELSPQLQFVTSAWLDYNLSRYKDKPVILFSHDPFFWDNKFDKLSEKYFLFAGHVHDRKCNDNITDTSNWYCERVMAKPRLGAIPTEAILEEYENVIRVVQIKDTENPTKEDIDYSKIEGIPKESAPDKIKRPDPYIVYTPSNPAPKEEITFIAKDEIREKDIKSCKWDFEDEVIDNSGKCELTHSYSPFILWKYTIKVTITYTDDTQRIAEKSIWVTPKFKLKIPQFIIPSLLIDDTIDVAENPQNTPESVFVTKVASEKKPIGIIGVHFEEATEDIDLSNLVADINLETRKSVLYMPEWPEVIEDEKVLFIPSSGAGKVYICPHAKSLEEVNPQCEDVEILEVGEQKGNLFVDTTTYNEQEYYLVYGIKGTGGGEAEKKEVRLETQIAITEMEYGEIDILNQITNQIGDKKPPLLLAELATATIDLEDYTPEGKINPGQKRKLKIKFKFLETAGNEYQGKNINVKFKFKATQEEQ